MTPSEPTAQTPAERRAAEAELRRLVAEHAAAHQRLVAAVRRTIRKRLPTAHELVYEYRDFVVVSYSAEGRGYEGALAVRASADGVKLYFGGGDLPDPERLLKGAGKSARWIAVEGTRTLALPAVARLMDEAVARSAAPFAPTGRGPVTIRATAAARRGSR